MVLLGGDFNEPSHLDWTRATKDLYNHHGFIIPWTVTLLLDNAGYIDAWRERYPDVLAHPGFTFPSDNPDVPVSKLAWAPKADERDRIDYIFYAPSPRLRLKNIRLFGPEAALPLTGARPTPLTTALSARSAPGPPTTKPCWPPSAYKPDKKSPCLY